MERSIMQCREIISRGSARDTLVALGCGAVCASIPLFFEALTYRGMPSTESLGFAMDMLWLPGSLCARVFYPAGVHTGFGSAAYVPVSVAFNVLLYFLAAYGLLLWRRKRRVRLNPINPIAVKSS